MASLLIRHVDEALHARVKASVAAPFKVAHRTSPAPHMIRPPA